MTDYQHIFQTITSDSDYLTHLDWGQARPGHPEGSIRPHIAELEQNLEVLRPRFSEEDAWKLLVLIHVHDTFKPDATEGVPIEHARSHASLARAFLAEYCTDADLLAMVQNHDVPFALYRQVETKGKYNQARFDAIVGAIRDWDLFLAFLIIDGCTEGKAVDSLRWFFGELRGRVRARISEADIIVKG